MADLPNVTEEKEKADGMSLCLPTFSLLGSALRLENLLPSEPAPPPAAPATPGLGRRAATSRRSPKTTFLRPSEDADPSNVPLAFCHHRYTKYPPKTCLAPAQRWQLCLSPQREENAFCHIKKILSVGTEGDPVMESKS